MKSTELRIGNWVLHNSHYHSVTGATIVYQKSTYKCEPIPLTPEILEKAEFVYSEDASYHKFILNKLILGAHIFNKEVQIDLFDCTGNNTGLESIKHLHQLQNLYWCLCGKELNIEL